MAGSTRDKTILRGMLQRIAALYDPAEVCACADTLRLSARYEQSIGWLDRRENILPARV